MFNVSDGVVVRRNFNRVEVGWEVWEVWEVCELCEWEAEVPVPVPMPNAGTSSSSKVTSAASALQCVQCSGMGDTVQPGGLKTTSCRQMQRWMRKIGCICLCVGCGIQAMVTRHRGLRVRFTMVRTSTLASTGQIVSEAPRGVDGTTWSNEARDDG